MKRLYRSREETQLVGACGGIGVYFGIDPVLVRLLWIIVTVLTGILPGVVVYLLAWLIMPLEPAPAPIVTPTEEPQQQGS